MNAVKPYPRNPSLAVCTAPRWPATPRNAQGWAGPPQQWTPGYLACGGYDKRNAHNHAQPVALTDPDLDCALILFTAPLLEPLRVRIAFDLDPRTGFGFLSLEPESDFSVADKTRCCCHYY